MTTDASILLFQLPTGMLSTRMRCHPLLRIPTSKISGTHHQTSRCASGGWLQYCSNRVVVVPPPLHHHHHLHRIHITLLLHPDSSWRSRASAQPPCWRWVRSPWASSYQRSRPRGCRSASCAWRPFSPARRSAGSATAPCRTPTPSECDSRHTAWPITVRRQLMADLLCMQRIM